MDRARRFGVEKALFSAGTIQDGIDSYELSLKSSDYFTTIGAHPCRANEVVKMGVEKYQEEMEAAIAGFEDKSKLVAIGECGLDYDRFDYASKEDQLAAFPFHFDLAEKYGLPLYLHNRNTDGDFIKMIKENRHKFSTGVVHSFTDDLDELKACLDLDLYIGVNGCSLKTEENLEVVKHIPLDRIMLETDCPYCEIRRTHATHKHVKTIIPKVKDKKYNPEDPDKMVNGRNEPCTQIQILEAVAAVKGVSEEELADYAWKNTHKMFGLELE